ncbi:MAG: PDZ domain-containing protein [Planctomycetota bacterium]|nr:PDZ domain-containing protein [Planctomycetota bacterium]
MPVLLVVLILAVLALAFVFALPYLKTDGGRDTPEIPTVSASQLEPEMLVTPTGRKLDVIEFGGYLFEITRLAYSNVPRARTVTITVPGKPPQMGVFHINESFAGGKIRVVEITSSSVVLEANGEQKVFAINGADPGEIWDKAPSGTQIIPPRDTSTIPDLPAGVERPAQDPRKEIPEQPPKKTGSLLGNPDDPEEVRGLEDLELPDVRPVPLHRSEYLTLVRDMADRFEKDLVLGLAIERDTRMVYGLQIKNLRGDSFFAAHGLRVGDVILAVNEEPVRNIEELNLVARSNVFRDEVRIELERDGNLVTFVFQPGVPD